MANAYVKFLEEKIVEEEDMFPFINAIYKRKEDDPFSQEDMDNFYNAMVQNKLGLQKAGLVKASRTLGLRLYGGIELVCFAVPIMITGSLLTMKVMQPDLDLSQLELGEMIPFGKHPYIPIGSLAVLGFLADMKRKSIKSTTQRQERKVLQEIINKYKWGQISEDLE